MTQKKSSIVTQPYSDLSSASIFSADYQIAFSLAQQLSTHQLTTRLIHTTSSDFLPSPNEYIHQFNFSDLSSLDQFQAEYIFCLFPSLASPTTFLDPILHLSEKKQSKLLFLELSQNPTNTNLLQKLKTDFPHLDYRFVTTSYVYGPNFDLHPASYLSQIFLHLAQTHTLNLPQSEDFYLNPLYVEDLSSGLLKAMFKTNTRHQHFYLGSLEQVSSVDFAYQIKESASEILQHSITIDLQNPQHPPQSNLDSDQAAASQVNLDWQPQVSLKQGIGNTIQYLKKQNFFTDTTTSQTSSPETPTLTQQTDQSTTDTSDSSQFTQKPLKRLKPLTSQKKSISKNRKLHRLIRYGLPLIMFLLIVLSPIIFFANLTRTAVLHLQSSVHQLEVGDTQAAKTSALLAQSQFTTLRSGLQFSRRLMFFLPLAQTYNKYDRLLDAATRLSQSMSVASQSVSQGQDLYHYILTGSPDLDLQASSLQLKSNLENLYNQLSLIEVTLKDVQFESRFFSIQQANQVKDKIPEIRDRLAVALKLVDILPSLINTPQPISYLVLLQNNAELRPTGGFIGSYALLTFQQGRLTDLQVQDVYSADGQLDGHVEPPEPIKEYLGEAAWYLRDSNWYPDFSASARQIEWFFEKETGTRVAGTIGLNLFTVQDLLKATGPIELPDFNETITSDNFFERAEYKSEINFFPGSTQKKDFLTGLTRSLIQKFQTGDLPLADVARVLSSSLHDSNIIISLADPQLQRVIEDNNWSGSLKQKPCPTSFNQNPCLSQTFSLIEANLGVNKSNYFLTRQFSQIANINKNGQLNHQLTITYQNSSPNNTWPAGDYKTYTRLYLPIGSQILTSTIDDDDLEILSNTVSSNMQLQEFAFYYQVPVNSTRVLTFTFTTPDIINTTSPLTALSLNWEKQPGMSQDNFALKINYPAYLKPEKISLPATSSPQVLDFSNQFTSDTSFAVTFKHQ